MNKEERYALITNWFRNNMPVAETELHYESVFQLLVAVVLSAQCTDKRVNLVTPSLFRIYPTAEAMAKASAEDIFQHIKSISYPNSKAHHLADMARMIVSDFNGIIPSDMNELIKLPGVGRKTANVIQAVAFNKATMAVDTHVFRVSHRLGLVDERCTTPLSVEKELVRNIESKDIPLAHHWLLLHGRYICTAKKPKCEDCGLSSFCSQQEKKINLNHVS